MYFYTNGCYNTLFSSSAIYLIPQQHRTCLVLFSHSLELHDRFQIY